MKHSLPVLLAATVLSTTAAAQDTTRAPRQPAFFGVKGGFMQPDGSSNSSAVNIAGVVGQRVHRWLSWEGELSLTLSNGEVGNDTNWDITTVAAYGVFRSEGKIGFKGKAGIAYWDTDTDNDLSLSMGVGLGIRAGRNAFVDIEFTEIDNGVDFISAGYVFRYR